MPVFHSNEVIAPSRKDEEHLLENIRPEAKPKEREQMYRSVLETVSDGIILQAASGEILIWNKGAEKIFGISAKEALGETSESKDWPTIREDGSKYEGKDHPSMRTLRTGQPCRNEIMGVGQSGGTLRWISINTNPLFRGNEALPYAVAISFSDITDLKREKDLSRLIFRHVLFFPFNGFALFIHFGFRPFVPVMGTAKPAPSLRQLSVCLQAAVSSGFMAWPDPARMRHLEITAFRFISKMI